MSECRCGKPTRDEAYGCEDCADLLGRALGDVPWLEEQIDITISRQKGATYDGNTSAGADKPLPINLPASEARENLRALMVSWIKLCAEEGVRSTDPRRNLPEDTMTAMSRWLLWRVDGLMLHEAASEAVDEITSAVAHCHRLVDRPPERRYIGPCAGCGRDLYAKPGAKDGQCRWCEHEWTTIEREEWMKAAMVGKIVTAREGSTLLGRLGMSTAQDTIDKWRQRKRITECGHNAQGHRLYRWDDLRRLAESETRAPAGA
jgi:hypothetical protein